MNCGVILLSMPCQEGGDGTRKFPVPGSGLSIDELSATEPGVEEVLLLLSVAVVYPPSYESSTTRLLGGESSLGMLSLLCEFML